MHLSIPKHISEHYPYWWKLKYSEALHTDTERANTSYNTTTCKACRDIPLSAVKTHLRTLTSCFVANDCIKVQHIQVGLDFRIKYVWNNNFWNFVSNCLIVNGWIYNVFGDKRKYIYRSR
jgi:hypothetical protein